MNYNLGHPDNVKANQLAQCQRVAALWVNQLSRGKITRTKVESNIAQYPTEEQALIRHWLNQYIGKTKKPMPKPSYKAALRWRHG